MTREEANKIKIEARPWTPQDLLDDLQGIIDEEPDRYLNTRRTTLCMALGYLKEHFAKQKNDSLTLDELREMDGEPVWVQYGRYDGEWVIVAWNIYDAISHTRSAPCELSSFSYGETWLAYRRKPEEGTT